MPVSFTANGKTKRDTVVRLASLGIIRNDLTHPEAARLPSRVASPFTHRRILMAFGLLVAVVMLVLILADSLGGNQRGRGKQ